ncbi:Ig-like domain repeat protein [Streptacidiphilus sp. PB12-B1b]|uniref:Ig-like domain repeat protein n=1 Tax=Streptacidiphilus sp. PB12-B1b TaxID=2705012 RepID=UPI0015FD6890|nr:Ig-like domain repeat protein [Streptacidiphilus sp. PB12-B1b]QMU79077.1 Ig-like domain repeat protein [Streptacidiphilus sp. PB12-B1b]
MKSARLPLAAAATALVLSITAATPNAIAAAPAPTAGVALAIAHFSHLVVDQTHGHLFVSGGAGTSGILVTDLTGATVTTLAEPSGATGLALSPDGTTLYAALPDSDAIATIDTTTLTQTAAIPTGTGTHPDSLAYAGSDLWFGYGTTGNGNIGSLTPTGTVTLDQDPNPWPAPPTLGTTPAPGDALAAAAQNGATATFSSYTTTGGALDRLATAPLAIPDLGDIALTPNGQDVVAGSWSGTQSGRFRMSDLAPDGDYTPGLANPTLAVAPDGTVAGCNCTGFQYETQAADGSGLYNYFRIQDPDRLAPNGLAWAPDESRLFAVATDPTGGTPTLQVQLQPDLAATQLHAGVPSPLAPGETFSTTVWLDSGVNPEVSTRLQVTRFDAAHPGGTPLPDLVEPAGWDQFTLTDTAPASGPLSYRIDYPGDADHQPASVTFTVPVAKYAPGLTLRAPTASPRTAQLTLTGQLTWPHPHLDTGRVQVTRTDAADPHGTPLGTVTVAADGSFTFHDTPSTGGANTYTVSYTGGASYLPATASSTVQVSRATTAVTVSTNAGSYAYNTWAQVTAHLGTTYNNRQVTLYAQPYGGARSAIRTATVDAHGNLSAWYKVIRNTTFTAAFGGDYRYAPAAASRTVWDSAQVDDIMRLSSSTATIGGTRYQVYYRDAPAMAPLFETTVSPDHSGQPLVVTLQRYSSGAWHTTSTSTGYLGSYSVYQAYLPWKAMPDYARYRVIAEYTHNSSDTTSLDSWGSWQYFTTYPDPGR